MNWFAVAPEEVAKAQVSWERDQTVVRMRQLGFTRTEIGHRFRLTVERIKQLEHRGRLRPDPPIMKWAQLDRAATEMATGVAFSAHKWTDPKGPV